MKYDDSFIPHPTVVNAMIAATDREYQILHKLLAISKRVHERVPGEDLNATIKRIVGPAWLDEQWDSEPPTA